MINEALIQSIVRNIVQRLQDEGSGVATPAKPESAARAAALPTPVEDSVSELSSSLSPHFPL